MAEAEPTLGLGRGFKIGNKSLRLIRTKDRIIKNVFTKINGIKKTISNISELTFNGNYLYNERYWKLIGTSISGDISFGFDNEDEYIKIIGTSYTQGKVTAPNCFVTSIMIQGDSYFDTYAELPFRITLCGIEIIFYHIGGTAYFQLPDTTTIDYTKGYDALIRLIWKEDKYYVRFTYNKTDYDFEASNFSVGSEKQFSISISATGAHGTNLFYFDVNGIVY